VHEVVETTVDVMTARLIENDARSHTPGPGSLVHRHGAVTHSCAALAGRDDRVARLASMATPSKLHFITVLLTVSKASANIAPEPFPALTLSTALPFTVRFPLPSIRKQDNIVDISVNFKERSQLQ